MFAGSPAVLDVELSFGGKQAATLTADKMIATISVERPVRDIILGNRAPGQYPYRMRVVQDDGTMLCGDFSANSADAALWIVPAMLAKCTECNDQ